MTSATGTTGSGEGPGVPVVDLAAVVRDLYRMADEARERRSHLLSMVAQAEREAVYADQIATILTGRSDL